MGFFFGGGGGEGWNGEVGGGGLEVVVHVLLLTSFIFSFSFLWLLNKTSFLQLICRANVACVSSTQILSNGSVIMWFSKQNSPR